MQYQWRTSSPASREQDLRFVSQEMDAARRKGGGLTRRRAGGDKGSRFYAAALKLVKVAGAKEGEEHAWASAYLNIGNTTASYARAVATHLGWRELLWMSSGRGARINFIYQKPLRRKALVPSPAIDVGKYVEVVP